MDGEKIYNFRQICKEFVKTRCWGMSTTIDIQNCNAAYISNVDKIDEYIKLLADKLKVNLFGHPVIVKFGDSERVKGYSFMQLIDTSSITGHFVDATNAAFIDIFSCKIYNPFEAMETTRKFFDGDESSMHVILRR